MIEWDLTLYFIMQISNFIFYFKISTDWWINFDEKTPNSRKVATRILSQITSSSNGEKKLECILSYPHKGKKSANHAKVQRVSLLSLQFEVESKI